MKIQSLAYNSDYDDPKKARKPGAVRPAPSPSGLSVGGGGSSSGGGTTINSTDGALPYRVNSTTFGDSGIFSNGSGLIGINKTASLAAQLDVLSASTTRPAGRFQAASGTSGTQEMLGVYDGSGNGTFVINAQGNFTSTAAATSTMIGMFKANNFETINVAGYFAWNGRSLFESPADGSFRFGNYAGTSRFVLAADANDVMAQRNGTNGQTLRVYNTYTDASNYERATLTWSSNVAYLRNQNAGTGSARLLIPVTGATTVAGLPSAATAGAGARAFVTDATATTFGSVVSGGGANAVPVYSDGTNWLIG